MPLPRLTNTTTENNGVRFEYVSGNVSNWDYTSISEIPTPPPSESLSDIVRRRTQEVEARASLSLNTRRIHRVRTILNDFTSPDREICDLYESATNSNRRGDIIPNGSQPENNDDHIGRHLDRNERNSIHHPEDDEDLSEDSIEI